MNYRVFVEYSMEISGVAYELFLSLKEYQIHQTKFQYVLQDFRRTCLDEYVPSFH